MTETALITGATAGLGAEFARQLAERGTSLVLVARDAGRLAARAAELKAAYGIDVETLAADLLTEDGLRRVVARVAAEENPVSTLVNNAGYGLRNSFEDNALETELDHLNIHVTVPLTLAHTALKGMRRRGRGYIINVASVAGFVPRGTYGMAKTAMISFSRWANIHFRPYGVTVTAVCPGFTHTEFHERMEMDKKAVPGWMWLQAEQVVREGLRDTAAGRAVSVPSVRYKALVALANLAPPVLLERIGGLGR